ncbi:antimicrobial peptide NK-lysin-like [Scomber scombrus]|uniref:Antimicrobial peptide NK-lysin-like n=1 Tax=Scomber scombrus TaxID=13677 RepID=A0AAV1NBN5_SCOSC|nr:antimicrobial peptide NK-lysin-like [Scomber scombrus]
MTMTSAISIALLLLSATVVNSWKSLEDQTEAMGDVSQFEEYIQETNHHAEMERFPNPSLSPDCKACHHIIGNVQKKLGSNKSKEEIESLLEKSCSDASWLRPTCNKIIRDSKVKLIDAIAKGGTPESLCAELKYC